MRATLLPMFLLPICALAQGLEQREPELWRRAVAKDQAALEALAVKASGDVDVHLLGRLALAAGYRPMTRSGASALLARMKGGFDPLASPATTGDDLALLESLVPATRSALTELIARIEALAPEAGNPILRRALDLGSREAKGALGLRLIQGLGVKADPESGFQMVMAAESALAEVKAGEALEAKDPARARKAYLDARKAEDPGIAYRAARGLERVGQALADPSLDAKAKEGYLRAAEGKHGAAAAALARFEAEGRGGSETSVPKAREWAEKAVTWGSPEGHYWLGCFDDLGQDRPRDLRAAFTHFRSGALAGDAASTYRLGMAHRLGEGTPIDAAEAKACFLRAADLGHPAAAFAVAEGLIQEGRMAEARARLVIAAKAGQPSAQLRLAELLLQGEGGPEDPDAARAWLERAAVQHNGEAHYRLALMDLDRARTKADAEGVIEHLRQAAREGHPEGRALLRLWRP